MLEVARMYKTEGNGSLKAFVDVIFDGQVLIKGVRVVEGKNSNLFVAMPKSQGKDGRWYETVTILDEEAKAELQEAVLEAYSSE